MFGALQDITQAISILLLGMAVGAGWMCVVAAPNHFYDKLDGQKANTQVRGFLLGGSTHIAGLLLGAAASAILSGAYAAGLVSLVASFGFFSNRWTLAPYKKGEAPPDASRKKSNQRVIAVGLSLAFLLAAVIAAVLALLGI